VSGPDCTAERGRCAKLERDAETFAPGSALGEPAGLAIQPCEQRLSNTLRISSGLFLVALGVVGLVLPIMPGWLFLIPGLVILSEHFPWAKRLLEWAKRKSHWGTEKHNG
jgi:hypothetical protein